MKSITFQQNITQFPVNRGFYYLNVDASTVKQMSNGKATRLICTIDEIVTFQCGLNHMGDGNFYIILSTKNFKKLKKNVGDPITYELKEDPNPLGVEEPEVLLVLLDQDEQAKGIYENMTDGRKRTLIHSILRVKNIDKKVEMILEFLENENLKTKNKRPK